MADELAIPFNIRLWPYGINWSESFSVTYEAMTEIIESRSKREQRISNRPVPRKSFEFRSDVKFDRRRDFHGLMAKWRALPVVIPEGPLYVKLTDDRLIGVSTLTVSEVTSWMVPDRFIVLQYEDRWAFSYTDTVTDTEVTLTEPLDQNWPAGTKVYCGVVGRLEDVQVTEETDSVWTVNVQFSAAPVQPVEDFGTAAETFNGREVFLWSPNWSTRPTSQFDYAVERIDYERGRREFFYPSDFLSRLRQATYTAMNRQTALDLRDFFHRMRGRQDEFYMSTGSPDLVLKSKTSSTLKVEGTAVYDDYAGDRVFTSLCVLLNDGTRIYRRVTGITTSGGDSVLAVTPDWTFTDADVKMISWFPVWRLAADRLTLEWLTDSVAQIPLSAVMIEDLDGD